MILGILFLFLVRREIEEGPDTDRTRATRLEAMSWKPLWFCLVAVMLAVYVVLDGFDLGAGIVHLLVARTDRRAPAGSALDRAGLGWQRSMAAGRRRHALLRLPGALFVELQRVLSAFDDRALAVDPARHLHRVPQPHRKSGLASDLGRRFSPAPAHCSRFSSAPLWATWCGAYRLTASGEFFLPLVDGFHRRQGGRNSGLVHDPDRSCGAADARGAWIPLGRIENRRSGRGSGAPIRQERLVGSSGMGRSDHPRQLPHSASSEGEFCRAPVGLRVPALGDPGPYRHPGCGAAAGTDLKPFSAPAYSSWGC